LVQRAALAKGCQHFDWARFSFCFAAFKTDIGVYPPLKEPLGLVEELTAYRGPKGNLTFPHSEPLPLELIGRIAEALANEYGRTG
jgi:hypothetical protein